MVLPGTWKTYVAEGSLAQFIVVHSLAGIRSSCPAIGVCSLCRLLEEGMSDFLNVFFFCFFVEGM